MRDTLYSQADRLEAMAGLHPFGESLKKGVKKHANRLAQDSPKRLVRKSEKYLGPIGELGLIMTQAPNPHVRGLGYTLAIGDVMYRILR